MFILLFSLLSFSFSPTTNPLPKPRLWLDSTYPVNSTSPSDVRGTCSTDSGDPDQVEKDSPDSSVTFSAVRFGTIGSTYDGGGGGSGNVCDADRTKCNVCGSCCKSYLSSQTDCDDCVTSEC